MDVDAVCFVVEGDIPSNDGDVQCFESIGHPLDRFFELPHHLRLLGVSEVQVVDRCHRSGASHRNVESGLVNQSGAADPGVEIAKTPVAVGRNRDCFFSPLDSEEGTVRARPNHRVQKEHVVVLGVDPS